MGGFKVGAVFCRMDLQVHSPRDPRWAGPTVKGIDKGQSEEQVKSLRAVWAVDFVDACLKKQLNAVAITDHHDLVMVEYVKSEIIKRWPDPERRPLWVYPGMEVTCKDPAQALILFDADMDLHVLNSRLSAALKLPADCGPWETHHRSQVEPLPFHLEQLQDILNADPELKGRFIILPNLTPSGHKTLLRKGFNKVYAALPYVGGYRDGVPQHEIPEGARKILAGEDPNWGSKHMPTINTSDARSLEQVGLHACWIKVADTTAEALRQAFLAPESRISEIEPALPAVHIRRVRVIGARILNDLDLELNPQMVALIGGRGSGKSTLLEYIRFALGDAYGDRPEDDIGVNPRRKTLIDNTLGPAGRVEVELSLNGSVSTLIRTAANPKVITQVLNSRDMLELQPDAVRRIIPFQAYSQGELSLLGEEDASERIRTLLIAPVREEIEREENNIRNLRSELRSAFEKMVQMWRAEVQLRELAAKLENLRHQLEAVKTSSPEMPASHIALADTMSKVTLVSQKIDRAINDLRTIREWLNKAPKEVLTSLDEDLPDLPEEFMEVVSRMQGLARSLRQEWVTRVDALSHVVEAKASAISSLAQQWSILRADLERRYEVAAAQAKEFEYTLKTRRRLEQEMESLEEQQQQLTDQINSLRDSLQAFSRLRDEIHSRKKKQRTVLQNMASQFEESSDHLARAKVIPGKNDRNAKEAIRRLTLGSRTRVDRHEALFDWIHGQADPHAAWMQVQDELVNYLRWIISGGRPDTRPPCQIISQTLGEAALSRIDADRVQEVVSTFLEDEVVLTYLRGNEEVPFHTASPGEQATALLAVLLSQKGGPLLLDQPEDDLDNKIITNIVENIRTAKQTRQLLVATHNANLVVNGDAEQVLYFEPSQRAGGKRCDVVAIGAIDVPEIKEVIMNTMEGGKEAFEMRRAKYHF